MNSLEYMFKMSLETKSGVNTQAIPKLAKQVQGTFFSGPLMHAEVTQLPVVLGLLCEENVDKDFPTLFETTDKIFMQYLPGLQTAQKKGGKLNRETTIPAFEARMLILNKMTTFATVNQELILQVKALKKNSPQEYTTAMMTLAKEAGKEVAAAIDLLADLNMNGVVSNIPSDMEIAAQGLEFDDFVMVSNEKEIIQTNEKTIEKSVEKFGTLFDIDDPVKEKKSDEKESNFSSLFNDFSNGFPSESKVIDNSVLVSNQEKEPVKTTEEKKTEEKEFKLSSVLNYISSAFTSQSTESKVSAFDAITEDDL